MKTIITAVVLLSIVNAGCNQNSEVKQPIPSEDLSEQNVQNIKRNTEAPDAHHPNDNYTHVTTRETPYYVQGPWQGTPPDGILNVGTKINVVKDAGSYQLVETSNGLKAYISADDYKKLNP